MIDTDKYEGHTPAPWRVVKPSHANATGHIWCIESATEIDYSPDHYTRVAHICVIHNEDDDTINAELIADTPLILEAYKGLREGIRSILSDYDITELIRDVPEEEWNFEQQALVRMKEMIE